MLLPPLPMRYIDILCPQNYFYCITQPHLVEKRRNQVVKTILGHWRVKQSIINRAIGPLREILLSHGSGPTMESVIQKFQKRKNHQDRNEVEVALMGRVVELPGAHQDTEDPELEVNYQACTSPIPGVRREEEYPSRERHRQREECPSKDASKRRQRPGLS